MASTNPSLDAGGSGDDGGGPPDPWTVVERALPLATFVAQCDGATTTILSGAVVVALVWCLSRRFPPRE